MLQGNQSSFFFFNDVYIFKKAYMINAESIIGFYDSRGSFVCTFIVVACYC